MKTGYTDAAGYCLVASARATSRTASAACCQRGAGHRLARGARQRKPEAAELGLAGLGRGAPVRSRQAGGHRAGVEGQDGHRRLGAPGAVCVTVPKGEGDKLKTVIERTDPLVAPLAQGQRVGTHQGHHRRRHHRWPACRWWCWRPWNWPACWAAPGTRSACGSSEAGSSRPAGHAATGAAATPPRPAGDHHRPARHPVLPERRVLPMSQAKIRCWTGASSSATASTRWCRSTAGACSASTNTWPAWSAAWTSCASPTRTAATSGCNAAALVRRWLSQPARRTRWSTSRSRAAWRRATTSCPRASRPRCS
jgi:hypothetical protein